MTTVHAVLKAELERLQAATRPAGEYLEDLTRHLALGEKSLEEKSVHIRERFAHLFQPTDADRLVAANAEVVRLHTICDTKQDRNRRLRDRLTLTEKIVEAQKGELEKLREQIREREVALAALNGEPAVPVMDSAPQIEIKHYADGASATGTAPLPNLSPGMQVAAEGGQQ